MNIEPENIFVVSNKADSNKAFQDLRGLLANKLKEQDSWCETRPVRWLKLEADMKETIGTNIQRSARHLTYSEVLELSQNYGMNSEELMECLAFLHSNGDVVWFPDEGLRDTITLDAQWLVDMFKILITSPQFVDERTRKGVSSLLNNGTVANDNLEIFWGEHHTEFLIEIMQKFGLLLPVESSSEEKKFLIPCMLPDDNVDIKNTKPFGTMSPAFCSQHRPQKFNDIFPIGTFSKLLSTCSWCWSLRERPLSSTHASFTIDSGILLTLSQSHGSTIDICIWSDKSQLKRNPLAVLLQSRCTLITNLRKCKIPVSDTFKVLCPHWRPGNPHFHTVDMRDRETAASASQYVEPLEKECICHSKALSCLDFDLAITPTAAGTVVVPGSRDPHTSTAETEVITTQQVKANVSLAITFLIVYELVSAPTVLSTIKSPPISRLFLKIVFQIALTDLHLIWVSKRLTNDATVRELAAHLEIPDCEVESALYDHRYINEAGLKVLRIFRDRMRSAEEAYQMLGEALVNSDLGPVAKHVLHYPCREKECQ